MELRLRELEEKLREAEDTLRAVRAGEIDAIVHSGPNGDRLFTLRGAHEPYRLMVQDMAQGAISLARDGLILFANNQFATLLRAPSQEITGRRISDYLSQRDFEKLHRSLSSATESRAARVEVQLLSGCEDAIPVELSATVMPSDELDCFSIVVTDLRGRKQNEEIVEAERLARSILEQAAGAILVVDEAGRIIRASRVAEQLVGVRLLLRTISDVFRPSPAGTAHPILEKAIRSAFQGATTEGVETEASLPGGRTVHILLSAAPLLAGSDARPAACIVTLTDITERKRKERQLRFQADILNNTAEAVFAVAPDGHITFWNKAAELLYGNSRQEALGKPANKIFAHAWISAEDECDAESALAKTGAWSGESVHVRADGRKVYVNVSISRISEEHGGGVFAVVRDITESKKNEMALRRSEQQFRRLYEANIIGIIANDSERTVEANDVYLDLLGYTRQDLQEGRLKWREITPEEYSYLDDRCLEELFRTGSCQPFEKELFRKDGSRIPVLMGATLLEENPPKWLSFIIDLRHRKALEVKLLEKQKLESIGLLAGGIAHDFNNLLVGILGNASLAKDQMDAGHPVRPVLDDVIKSGERAAHLTRQMLAYAGKGRFLIENIDVNETIRELTRLLQSSVPQQVEIRLELAGDLPPVQADAAQMQQVVMNLILNAGEAIASNPGVVTVQTNLVTIEPGTSLKGLDAGELEPGSYIRLMVRDTGCGMDEATKARIFDPFFTTKDGGRGLGLAAVSGIVRSHKGALVLHSAPGKGSTFELYFPIAPEADTRNAAQHSGEREQAAGTILVVDDERIVLRMAQSSLERAGFSVMLADNGPEAIEIVRNAGQRLAGVLLDLRMPGMSGQQILPRIREFRPDLPVIISSGHGETEALEFFSGSGIAGFIQKPYTARELARTVKSLLARE